MEESIVFVRTVILYIIDSKFRCVSCYGPQGACHIIERKKQFTMLATWPELL